MILKRYDSLRVMGVYISPNMEINVLVAAIEQAFTNRPELVATFNPHYQALKVLQTMDTMIHSKMQIVVDMEQELKQAKRTLELAVKVFNAGATTTANAMDIKPAVNGSPLAVGANAILNPLKVAVETGTTALQDLEDLIDAAMDELKGLTADFKIQQDAAVDSLMDKISEVGNINIHLDDE